MKIKKDDLRQRLGLILVISILIFACTYIFFTFKVFNGHLNFEYAQEKDISAKTVRNCVFSMTMDTNSENTDLDRANTEPASEVGSGSDSQPMEPTSEPQEVPNWINDLLVITIIIIVLLILLVIFRIFENGTYKPERKRITNTRAFIGHNSPRQNYYASHSSNHLLDQRDRWFSINNNEPAQDFSTFRCWRCNANIEANDYCPYCGWHIDMKRDVGYWPLFR